MEQVANAYDASFPHRAIRGRKAHPEGLPACRGQRLPVQVIRRKRSYLITAKVPKATRAGATQGLSIVAIGVFNPVRPEPVEGQIVVRKTYHERTLKRPPEQPRRTLYTENPQIHHLTGEK